MSISSFKILYLNTATGEFGRLPDSGIANFGGTSSPTFTVGGRALLFADGTSTDGSGPTGDTLQNVYDNSDAPAVIQLSTGKALQFTALNSNFFSMDAATGAIHITGDLTVDGAISLSSYDHLLVTPGAAGVIPVAVEPDQGVTLTTDAVNVKLVHGGPAVLRVSSAGVTTLQSLTVGSTDFGAFYTAFQTHIGNSGVAHAAANISVNNTFTHITGTNVQAALASVDSQLTNIGNAVQTYEFIQSTAILTWVVAHNKNSTRPTVTIYDTTNHMVIPNDVAITDANTITVSFHTAQAGRAIILLF